MNFNAGSWIFLAVVVGLILFVIGLTSVRTLVEQIQLIG
jgi:hypothetical protein